MFVDNVMRKTKDQSLIIEGVALFRSLNETNRVILLTDNRERTDIWMKTNNLAKKLDDIIEISQTELGDPEIRQIDQIRSSGKIDFVVTSDVAIAGKLIEVGTPVLVFLNPKYTRPEFRPGSREGIRSWETITNELDKQQKLYETDQRAKEEEPVPDGYTDEADDPWS
jgi:hypothetical protein